MREHKLYKPIKEYFEKLGYSVKPEIAVHISAIDLVAIKDGHVIAVELKTSLTLEVIRQANRNLIYCDESYVAVGTRPRVKSVKRAREMGIGVLNVWYGRVGRYAKPEKSKYTVDRYKQRVIEKHSRAFDGVGGLPSMKGCGPAQDCKRRIAEYKKEHPKATWKELFENVPNHYASARSMQSSLTKWW